MLPVDSVRPSSNDQRGTDGKTLVYVTRVTLRANSHIRHTDATNAITDAWNFLVRVSHLLISLDE